MFQVGPFLEVNSASTWYAFLWYACYVLRPSLWFGRAFNTRIWRERIINLFCLKFLSSFLLLTQKFFSGDQPCQCWIEKKRFRELLDLHHQGGCDEWLYVASSYWCIMQVGGRSQSVRSPIRLWPFTVLLNVVFLLSDHFVYLFA
jgi:hypothetical protein